MTQIVLHSVICAQNPTLVRTWSEKVDVCDVCANKCKLFLVRNKSELFHVNDAGAKPLRWLLESYGYSHGPGLTLACV